MQKEVWFEVKQTKTKEFLKWAKSQGCIWAGGEEIDPDKGANFFHFVIINGKLYNVPMHSWVARTPLQKSKTKIF